MKILAIESSCDETAAAVVENGRTVLSSCVASQIEMHTIYGGVVPEIASRKHVEAVTALAEQALAQAGLSQREIDAIAVTYAPGLIGALLVGVNFAKGAALALERSGADIIDINMGCPVPTRTWSRRSSACACPAGPPRSWMCRPIRG